MTLKVLFFVLWIPASIVAALVVFRLSKQETRALPVALLAGPACGLLGGYLVALFVQCIYQPLDSWDAWASEIDTNSSGGEP